MQYNPFARARAMMSASAHSSQALSYRANSTTSGPTSLADMTVNTARIAQSSSTSLEPVSMILTKASRNAHVVATNFLQQKLKQQPA